MDPKRSPARLTRRGLIAGAALMTAWPALAGAVATPRQPTGPFYPIVKPLDRDADLTRVEGKDGRARGEIIEVVGRIVDADGQPVKGAWVEIWQTNAFGRYHHRRDMSGAPLDPFFQGYGEDRTDVAGAYRFRTVRPAPYAWRTRHIHFKIVRKGFDPFITQMYFEGEPLNARDFILQRVQDPAERRRLIIPFDPLTKSGRFDIFLA